METRRGLTRSYATIPEVVTVVAIALLALSNFLPTGNAAAQIQSTDPSMDDKSLEAESMMPLKPHESSPTVSTLHHTWDSMAHGVHAERHLIAPLIKNRNDEGHHEASSRDRQHRRSRYRGGGTLGTPEERLYSASVPFISNVHQEGYVPQSVVASGKEGRGRALFMVDGEEGSEVSQTDVYELPDPTYLDPKAFLWGNETDRPDTPSQGGAAKEPRRRARRQRIRDSQGQSSAAAPEEASAAAAGGDGGLTSNIHHQPVGRMPPIYSCDLMLSPEACRAFAAQTPLPAPLPPRGSKACHGGCGAGNCQYDLGVCMCPAGATGANCELPLKRPCAHR